jgi:hypothetical protein
MHPLVWITQPLLLLAAIIPAFAETIPLEHRGGTYILPVRINDAITLKFTLDSGAADVSVPADVVRTLERAGTIEAHDFIGTRTYILADGSKLPSPQFILRELKIGNHVVRNVTASVAPVEGEPLLGQSFLAKLPRWMIDNNQQALIINDEIAPMLQRSSSTAVQSKANLPPEIKKSPAKILPSNALEASDVRWVEAQDGWHPSAYSFVLRNKTRQDLSNVTYVVIFYGDQGTPIESVQGQLHGTIMAGLAKSLDSVPNVGDAPYPGTEIRKSTRRIEVRIMDYETLGSQ